MSIELFQSLSQTASDYETALWPKRDPPRKVTLLFIKKKKKKKKKKNTRRFLSK